MIEEILYHVGSNEIAEDVDERREQRFQRRVNGRGAMALDAGDDVQLNVAVGGPADVLQHGLVGLCAEKCPGDQGVVSVVADRTSENRSEEHTSELQSRFGISYAG